MEIIQKALRVLEETESSLRDLLSEAVQTQRYGDVAQVAVLAEKLTSLRKSLPVKQSLPATSVVDASNGSQQTEIAQDNDHRDPLSIIDQVGKGSRAERSGSNFPMFARDGDRLVKIGWSAREHRAYEHRAPKEVVTKVCEALGRRSAKRRRFRMEEILPELATEKEAIPAYQAYLTLAWLRTEGAIERDGKDGYRTRNGSLSPDRIEMLWNSLTRR